MGYTNILQWLPAHRGIEGNEAAESLAKEAAVAGQMWSRPPEWQEYIRFKPYLSDACSRNIAHFGLFNTNSIFSF